MEAPKTFRDFAAAVMVQNHEHAACVLQELLQLDVETARNATHHFTTQMAQQGAAFMPKAMGLRAAKESGDRVAITALLVELFALPAHHITTAIEALLR